MSTELHRVVLYVLGLNDGITQEDLKTHLENYKYVPFAHVDDIQTTDVGEWDDDHELNYTGANYGKYFPDVNLSSKD